MSRLTIFRDDAFLEEHVLMRATVALGRHPENDIVLDDRTLSRFHARLERRGDRYVVIDLGAQNGIYLNGNKITGECDLVPGDRIGLGRYVAIFDQDNASPSRRRGERREAAPARALRSEDAAPTMHGERYGGEVERAAGGFDRASGRTAPHDDDDSFEGPTTAVEKRAPVPTLVLLYNGLEVSRHLVGASKPLIIGRSKGSDVVISLLGLSRRHSKVSVEGGAVIVRDLGSQNGTWVNNARIEGARTLQHGDLLNFYEYGILYLDDPDVELGEGTGFPQHADGDDVLAARETGRQDPPSVQTKPLISSKAKSKKRPPEPTRRSLRSPLSDLDDEGGQPSDLDALDLGEGSYLGEEFDDLSEDFGSSLANQQPLDDGTDVVKAYQPGVDEDSDDEPGTETSRTLPREDDFASASQTSTVRGKQGAKREQRTADNRRAPWPGDVELEDALSQPGGDRLASLEIYLGERLFTQVPLSNPVTRIGADPRCELALPPRAKLRPWHVTLVNFSGATLCVRGSKKGRVRIDGSDIDQTVLRDGDSIDLGHVRVVYRCR